MSDCKKKCSICRSCTWIEKKNTFVCHNESSKNFGADLGTTAKHYSCADFLSSRGYGKEALTLEEALEIVTTGNLFEKEKDKLPEKKVYSFIDYHLPDDDSRPFFGKIFSTNEELDNYRDAIDVLFAEFMRLKFPKEPKEEAEEDELQIDYAAEVSEELSRALGRKVRLLDKKRTGRIELEYYGAEDREALISALRRLKKEE